MANENATRTVRLALVFELGLGMVALGVGWAAGHWPLVGLESRSQTSDHITAIGWGLVATGPLLAALVLMDHVSWQPIQNLRELAGNVIERMFGGATIWQLAAVSLAAGFGEELLFRGLIQAGLSRLIGGPPGLAAALVLASVLFGVCHWLNSTYAVLAMLAGAYFGVLLIGSGSILTPLVAHAAYDFLALAYLIRPWNALGSDS